MTYDKYYAKVRPVFQKIGFECESIHMSKEPKKALEQSDAIFIGGGNTFLLLYTLYEKDLIATIRKRVLDDGVPYMGSSAGTNVATNNICTTNDMPIIHPRSFEALNLVPFNINPHYLDVPESETHKGETRDERIKEYMELTKRMVLGLREGCILLVESDTITVLGVSGAVLFQWYVLEYLRCRFLFFFSFSDADKKELAVGTDISYILNGV